MSDGRRSKICDSMFCDRLLKPDLLENACLMSGFISLKVLAMGA